MVACLVLLAAAAQAVAFSIPGFGATSLPLIALAMLAFYLARRRAADALLAALPFLAAEATEFLVGPQLFACVALFCYCVTRRPRFAVAAGAIMLGSLWFANRLKEQFAGTPLTCQDLTFFFARLGANLQVLASQPNLLMQSGLALGAIAAFAVAVWRWEGPLASAGARWPQRVALGLALGLTVWSAQELRLEVRRTAAALGAWSIGQPTQGTAVFSRFLATLALQPVWSVPGTDTSAFGHQVRSQMAAGARPQRRPADIVAFLQESQFDPATIQGCAVALCGHPVFDGGAATVAQGPLRVHVFGGGTWLTEFAFATGIPHTVYGRAGEFAPFNVAPGIRQSFVRSLKAAGYRTVAVYPVNGGMMNARSAYAGYGFDRFYDAADLDMSGGFDTPDAAMHAAALRVLAQERVHGRPVLMVVLTIFNHGEHGVRLQRIPPELLLQAQQQFADVGEARHVADYVWRTHEFARAMADTSQSLLQSKEPVVLAWFGDHQPPFAGAQGLRGRVVAARGGHKIPGRFQTWYHIATNQSGPPASGPPPPRALDIAFLGGVLAQAAGVPPDPWIAANTTARDLCGGLLIECGQPHVRDAYLNFLAHELEGFEVLLSRQDGRF